MEGGGAGPSDGGAGGGGGGGGGRGDKVDVNSLVSCKIDNLPFEATKDDLSGMFSSYGELIFGVTIRRSVESCSLFASAALSRVQILMRGALQAKLRTSLSLATVQPSALVGLHSFATPHGRRQTGQLRAPMAVTCTAAACA